MQLISCPTDKIINCYYKKLTENKVAEKLQKDTYFSHIDIPRTQSDSKIDTLSFWQTIYFPKKHTSNCAYGYAKCFYSVIKYRLFKHTTQSTLAVQLAIV